MLRRFFALGLAALSAPALADTALPVVGARAGSLAGAFTAVADDVTAFHWNPAGLIAGPLFRAGGFGSAAFEDRGDLVNRLRAGTPGNDDSSLTSDGGYGFAAALTLFGVAVSRFSYTSSALVGEELRADGLETVEITGTFIHSLPVNELTIGASVRYVRGTAYESARPASSVPPDARNVSDLVDFATARSGRSESEPAFDLGVLYEPRPWVRLGFAARNLNRPTFRTTSSREIALARSARLGAALGLRPSVLVALDVDLAGRGEAGYREVALGVEKSWREKRYSLRGGLRGESSGGSFGRPGFSAGFGVTLPYVLVEIAGSVATERRQSGVWIGVSLAR